MTRWSDWDCPPPGGFLRGADPKIAELIERETARQILLYPVFLVVLTLIPVLTGTFGAIYLAAAAILGARFVQLAWALRQELTPKRAGVLFHYSLAYLALLFVAMAIDVL